MKSRSHSEYLFCLALLATFLIGTGYVGAEEPKKILCIEAFDMLNALPDTYLIDVRSREEYQLVGHPLQAYNFPYMFFTTRFVKEGERKGYQLQKNKGFLDQINKAFKKTDNLLILDRDGVRSALAAQEISNAGFKNVYDVYDGFEGAEFPHFEDPNRQKFYRQLAKRYKINGFEHRRHYGWQWWGLPWTYAMDPKYVYPPDLGPPEK
jgi:rhodanese-related sulfurtransferase